MTDGPHPPADPAELDLVVEVLPAGSLLFRVHPEHLDPHAFNPRHGGGGRFHFIARGEGEEKGQGEKVPALYAAGSLPAALSETIFHDVPLRPRSFRALALRKLRGRVVTELRTRRDLRLVQLHHPGLGRLGLKPEEITATDPSRYPRTRRWAQALHDHGDAPDGLVWMSRLHNTDRAHTFFGDRVASDDLEPASRPLPLWTRPGLDLVYELAEAAGITLVHP